MTDKEIALIVEALREAGESGWLRWLRRGPILFLVAMLIGFIGWFFRSETLHSDRDKIYLLNRWTGQIRYVQGDKWLPVTKVERPEQ